jgi:NAD(P)-dependent dehydrogenase (short-subunit alcohol dehydrogenase family)
MQMTGRARFADRVAIVTGAASGIGLATAQRLASEGARVVIADVDEAALRTALAQLQRAGATALAQRCDVSDDDDVHATVHAALDHYGRLDVLVNNAAVMTFAAIVDLAPADWRRVIDINLTGPFLLMRAGLTHMGRGGAVVNVSSIHAEQTTANVAPYAASKAALLALTHVGAIEGRPRGVRVNAVLPGAVDTPMLWHNPNVQSGAEKINRQELGEPPDLAAAIAFLASDDAHFINGAALPVDGGRLAEL